SLCGTLDRGNQSAHVFLSIFQTETDSYRLFHCWMIFSEHSSQHVTRFGVPRGTGRTGCYCDTAQVQLCQHPIRRDLFQPNTQNMREMFFLISIYLEQNTRFSQFLNHFFTEMLIQSIFLVSLVSHDLCCFLKG